MDRRRFIAAAALGAVGSTTLRAAPASDTTSKPIAASSGLDLAVDELCRMSAREMSAAFAGRRLSPVEALKAVIARAEAVNPYLSAFYWRDDAAALKAAAAAEQRWQRGEPLSPIDGLPISVKDSLALPGAPTYLGSAINLFAPLSTTRDPLVERFVDQGAVVFAKTSMVETGFFHASISALYGPVRNPWHLGMTPGGSTSGGAAAAAAFAGPVHVGSDGGGSLRTPASSCGCVSLKTTAHLPPYGLARGSAANDKQTKGFITRDVHDQRFVFGAIAQTTGDADESRHTGLRIGYLEQPLADPTVGSVHKDIRAVLEAAVGKLQDKQRIDVVKGAAFHGEIAGAAAFGAFSRLAANYRHSPRSVFERMHPIVRENIELLMAVDAGRVTKMLDQQRLWLEAGAARIDALFEHHDLLLLPTMFHPAFAAERGWHPDSPLVAGMKYAWSCGANPHLSWVRQGPPSISIPCGLDRSGCPVGLLLVGPPGADLRLLDVAATLQDALDGWNREPHAILE